MSTLWFILIMECMFALHFCGRSSPTKETTLVLHPLVLLFYKTEWRMKSHLIWLNYSLIPSILLFPFYFGGPVSLYLQCFYFLFLFPCLLCPSLTLSPYIWLSVYLYPSAFFYESTRVQASLHGSFGCIVVLSVLSVSPDRSNSFVPLFKAYVALLGHWEEFLVSHLKFCCRKTMLCCGNRVNMK